MKVTLRHPAVAGILSRCLIQNSRGEPVERLTKTASSQNEGPRAAAENDRYESTGNDHEYKQ